MGGNGSSLGAFSAEWEEQRDKGRTPRNASKYSKAVREGRPALLRKDRGPQETREMGAGLKSSASYIIFLSFVCVYVCVHMCVFTYICMHTCAGGCWESSSITLHLIEAGSLD